MSLDENSTETVATRTGPPAPRGLNGFGVGCGALVGVAIAVTILAVSSAWQGDWARGLRRLGAAGALGFDVVWLWWLFRLFGRRPGELTGVSALGSRVVLGAPVAVAALGWVVWSIAIGEF